MTDALRAGSRPDAPVVEKVEFERIGEGRGFIGVVARGDVSYQGGQAESRHAPATLIAKLVSADPAIHERMNRYGGYERETLFYKELAAESGIPLPECYYGRFDSKSGLSVLLLEDLSGLREGDEITGCTPNEAVSVAQYLARLHARWWNDQRLRGLDWLIKPPSPERAVRSQEEYRAAWNQSADRLAEIFPSEVFAIAERFGRKLAEYLISSAPRDVTLNHGDCHLGNTFFRDDVNQEGVVLIDWQAAGVRRPASDLAYFLQGSLVIDDRRKHEESLLSCYRESLAEGGVTGYTRDALVGDYRRGLLMSLLESVFAVANLDMDDARDGALLKTIGARMIGIADWECGDLIPE